MILPEDLPKLVLEMTAGSVEVIQVGQNAALSRGAVCRVHARFHHDAQPANIYTHGHMCRVLYIIRQDELILLSEN